jgi:hypothetical protein
LARYAIEAKAPWVTHSIRINFFSISFPVSLVRVICRYPVFHGCRRLVHIDAQDLPKQFFSVLRPVTLIPPTTTIPCSDVKETIIPKGHFPAVVIIPWLDKPQ